MTFSDLAHPLALMAAMSLAIACGSDRSNSNAAPRNAIDLKPVDPKLQPSANADSAPAGSTSAYGLPTDTLGLSSVIKSDSVVTDQPDTDGLGWQEEEDVDLDIPGMMDDHPDQSTYDTRTDFREDGVAESRLVRTQIVKVINLEHKDVYDSILVVIEERMSLRPDPVPRQMVLERWISPVNYRGYKFNRRKLMLYGVEVHQPVAIYHYLSQYYVALGNRIYALDEHFELSPFVVIKDEALTEYLLQHDP